MMVVTATEGLFWTVEVMAIGVGVTTMVLERTGAELTTTTGAELTTTTGDGVVLTTGTGAGVVLMTGTELMMEEQLRGTWGWPSPIWVTAQVTGAGRVVIVVTIGVGVAWTVEVIVAGGGVTTMTLVITGAVVWVV